MNPRLTPMNKQARIVRLEAGQAFSDPRGVAGPAVLLEGELQVQEAARWLGERVVVEAPVRIAAPALLQADSSAAIVAVSASAVLVHDAVPLPARAWNAAASWLREVPRRTRGALRHVAG